tara:strand:- start:3529 stop:4392 length:864 start_codon:yes stop_codon:yes gene_type:complete
MNQDSIVDLVKQHQAGNPGGSPQEAPKTSQEGAVDHKAQMMSENIPVDKNVEAALEALLGKVKSKMAWSEIVLPSQGLLYPDGQKTIRIRPFTFEDERILKSMDGIKDPDAVIERLLRNATDGLEVGELTPHDRVYVLYRLRGISYGDGYEVSHDCDKCSITSKLELSIKSLTTTNLTREHMVFNLPDSEQECEVKLPRMQDEHLYNNNSNLMNNMHMFVYRVGNITDKTIIEAFIHKTTVRDIDTLRNRIFAPEYGMENHFFYTCAGCSTKNKVDIQLNENFFTAS